MAKLNYSWRNGQYLHMSHLNVYVTPTRVEKYLRVFFFEIFTLVHISCYSKIKNKV